MLILKKIIAWIMVFAMAISILCVPAFSSDGSFGGDRDSTGGGRYEITDFYNFAGGRESGGGGRFSSKEAYTDYVGTLPATGYTSEGALIWQLIPIYISNFSFCFSYGTYNDRPISVFEPGIYMRDDSDYGTSIYSVGWDLSIPGLKFDISPRIITERGDQVFFQDGKWVFSVPVSGYYKVLRDTFVYWDVIDYQGYNQSSYREKLSGGFSSRHVYAGDSAQTYSFNFHTALYAAWPRSGYFCLNLPVFEIIPDPDVDYVDT